MTRVESGTPSELHVWMWGVLRSWRLISSDQPSLGFVLSAGFKAIVGFEAVGRTREQLEHFYGKPMQVTKTLKRSV